MTERSNKPQNSPAENEHPEVYSVSQDQDGSFHFSRGDFLTFSAVVGGALLLRGVCPRFGAKSAPSEAVQAGMMPLPKVSVHTAPSIASNIAGTLQQNDLVRLISDHPDLGWVEVATQSGQQGWVKRSFVDFSRAIKSSSRDFDLSSTLTPTPTQTEQPRTLSVQLRDWDRFPKRAVVAGKAYPCGNAIQNGGFEDGSAFWVEESTGDIIRNDWPDPYQGESVAWLGGLDIVERLTQLFHVPADVQDAQTLEFYLKVTSEETATQAQDTLCLRFLDASGSPISSDIAIADNTTRAGWLYVTVELGKMTEYADQDMQIQFESNVNDSKITSFVIDSVSLELICEEVMYYSYLPVVVRAPTPTPTNTPTSTPTPSATPCPSHNSCPGYCSSDCSSHCSSDCSSDCSSQCPLDCVFDCLHCSCIGHWCSYN